MAGAASIVLLVGGVALCALAGVDAPGVSDAVILERVDDRANQADAGVGLLVLAAGTTLLLWFAVGMRRSGTGSLKATPSRMRSCRRRCFSAGCSSQAAVIEPTVHQETSESAAMSA